MPRLTVTRGRDWAGIFRGIQVTLDEQQIGTLRPNQTITTEVEPGSYSLQAKIDWTYSNALPLVVEEANLRVTLRYPFRAITRVFRGPPWGMTLSLDPAPGTKEPSGKSS